jgi:uncharacterized surface protein with fasciclin (FAS1) repeats
MQLRLLAAMIALASAAPAAADEFRPIFVPSGTSFEGALAHDSSHFSTMIGLLRTADLPELKEGKTATLLAPTDKAFAAYPQQKVQLLIKDKAAAQSFLRAHLIPGRVVFQEMFDRPNPTGDGAAATRYVVTFGGSKVQIQCNDHPASAKKPHYPLIGGRSRVLEPDIIGQRGVIQVIDKPLVDL